MRLSPLQFLRSAALAAILVSAAAAEAADVLVFAAASQREALEEVVAMFERTRGKTVAVSYAASSTLARQIEQGAPADVFISANPAWMDYLQERDLIHRDRRADLIGNELVLVAPLDSETEIEIGPDFPLAPALGGGRLAMGDPDHVPAGIYGKAALTALGVWPEVRDRLARTGSVRGALALVSRGEVLLGVVYASDARADRSVRIVGRFPADSHPPIVYPAAMTREGRSPYALDFFNFLWWDSSKKIYRKHGFTELN